MNTHVHGVVIATGLLAVGTLLAADEKKPPSIVYPGSRSSNTWIDTPTGRVAVDEGIEWDGVKVYLSLTWHLVAVDVKTDKTLWAQNVSAFWNTMSIKEVEIERGKKVWAVELRPGKPDDRAKNLVAYHDLKTGKKLELPGLEEKPSGTVFKPRKVFSGEKTSLARGFWLVVTSTDNWTKVRERLFAGLDKADAPLAKDVDFTQEVVLVISSGDSTNCNGISCAEAYEDEKRILVRLHHHTFGTVGRGVPTRPYGIFILPRAEKKAYVIENNRQSYKVGPPIWGELYRAERLGDPAKELERLPE